MAEVVGVNQGVGGSAISGNWTEYDATLMQNGVLIIALGNMVVNLMRIVKLLDDTYFCTENTKGCKVGDEMLLDDKRPWLGVDNHGYKKYKLGDRGPEILCYATMVFVHSRLFKAAMQDDQDTIWLWLQINGGLTILGMMPLSTYPSVWGVKDKFEILVGKIIVDILQYGVILEYLRAKKTVDQDKNVTSPTLHPPSHVHVLGHDYDSIKSEKMKF
ncbi:uncharacterized protein LOC110857167 [Folsomia candida]|uniref:uncharacterized protein LOC110857167 n=1 Tax=Folsomia candida TaxID=158441 RepID=UPI000B900547|nr:uncharacterized protein LOC110857167 [Folsomia candida]